MLKSELVEIWRQPGLVEIIGHHPAARRTAMSSHKAEPSARFPPLFSPATRGDHHRGIAGIGATGDRGDGHVAMRELHPLIVDSAAIARRPVVQMLGGGGSRLVFIARRSVAGIRMACHRRFGRPAIQPRRGGFADFFLEDIHQRRAETTASRREAPPDPAAGAGRRRWASPSPDPVPAFR